MSKLGKLDELKIKGYKSIKDIHVKFNNINILIGPNGVGKSNFIEFFNFVRKILEKNLEIYVAQSGGANNILYFGKKTTQFLEFSLLFTPNGYKAILVPDNYDGFVFHSEKGYFFADKIGYMGGEKIYELNSKGEKESKLPSSPNTQSPLGHIVKYLKDWKVYHFHDTSKSSPMKQTCDINDYLYFNTDGSNLAAFLFYIKQNYELHYKKIVKTIQRVVPYFLDFVLEPEPANKEKIRLRWRYKGYDKIFDVSDLSDGTLRFICLTTLLLQPNLPTMILIDEPELGLHPFALEVLASMFKLVADKTQIIASTQSSTFVDMFEAKDILVVDIVDNATNFKRLNENELKEWLEEYSIGELWQKNLIGGNP